MSKASVQKEISHLLEVIKEQNESLFAGGNNIPRIELDIVMNNVSRLYERLMELRSLKEAPAATPKSRPEVHNTDDLIAAVLPVAAIPVEENTTVEEAPVQEEHTDAHLQPETLVAEVTTKEEIAEETPVELRISQERTREFTKPASKGNTAPASLFDDIPSVTVADKFQGTTTLYDKITKTKEDKSLAGKMQKNALSDLKKSIGINEKFAFINELFDGDMNTYNQAIDQLNGCENLQHATSLMAGGFDGKFTWKEDGEAYKQLFDLVTRRYSA